MAADTTYTRASVPVKTKAGILDGRLTAAVFAVGIADEVTYVADDDLVLFDLDDNTLYPQMASTGLNGPRKRHQLEPLPVVETTCPCRRRGDSTTGCGRRMS